MAFEENFNDIIKVDPLNRITADSETRLNCHLIRRDETTYAYFDKGVDHFDGDFEHYFDKQMYFNSNNLIHVYYYGLANTLNDFKGMIDAGDDALVVGNSAGVSAGRVYFRELDGGSVYNSVYFGGFAGQHYIVSLRTESVGTYGTWYTRVYSDPERTNLLFNGSIALHSSKKDYQYLYGCMSYNDGNSAATTQASFLLDNLKLNEPPPPPPPPPSDPTPLFERMFDHLNPKSEAFKR